jgi:transcriptional regulator with XRE-family HTH domain
MIDQMGSRIKKKRESLGLQIKDLSKQIGMTSSLISQIENAKAFPSIVTLKKLADALHTTVGELIGENENQNQIKKPLLKVAERRFTKSNKKGTSSHLLSYHFPLKQIEPYLLKFEKESDSKGVMTSKFPGQEFCFVLKGKFEATVNRKKHLLEKGDGFYFDSIKPHLFKNISEGEAELIWVITPLLKSDK